VSLTSIRSPRRPSVMPAGVIAAARIVIALRRADDATRATGAGLEHQEAWHSNQRISHLDHQFLSHAPWLRLKTRRGDSGLKR